MSLLPKAVRSDRVTSRDVFGRMSSGSDLGISISACEAIEVGNVAVVATTGERKNRGFSGVFRKRQKWPKPYNTRRFKHFQEFRNFLMSPLFWR